MSQFWGISLNDDSRVECALHPYCDSLAFDTGNAGGWGLGYYSRGELLQRVEPRKYGETLDGCRLASGLRADLIIMHTRMATVGPAKRVNIHPFRFQQWLFAHNGTIEGFETFRKTLIDSMPPFIQRRLRGDTDSEHLFYLFLSFLYDAGVVGRSDLGTDPIRAALVRTFAAVDELARMAGFPCSDSSVVVSDGYSFVVGSRGIPVDYTVIDTVADCQVCRRSIQPGQNEPSRVDHPDLKAVLVISKQQEQPPPGFKRLDKNSLLLVSKKSSYKITSFG